ncbi:MAG: phytase [Cyanobacteria bacterium CRU_2_1]|nr:phytase [Cyanobacteria bacterium CRU_2_1]
MAQFTLPTDSPTDTIRFSQFNASLNRGVDGQLVTDLSTPDNAQAKTVAEIIQRNNPDVLLINEFDYVADDPLLPVRLFQQNYLSVGQNGADPVSYPYVYIASSNTGIASGFDLNNNGEIVTQPGSRGYGDDALGFGNFPGQFGMVLLSKYPIDTANVRTFQEFRWKDMLGALLPDDPNTPEPNDWYSPEELEVFRLSSKSHWDVPIIVNGETVHALVSHPTPPVFDGAEDRNGKRNHDEIRFWADYITPGQNAYIYDDNGDYGGLAPGSRFVIMGDQNADPNDGDSVDQAIQQLLDHPLVNTSVTPTSEGGPDASARQGGANTTHISDPMFDTADFADTNPGNLRTDYVLPSQNLDITDAQVFWPKDEDPLFRLVGDFDPTLPGGYPSSDHRLVWADLKLSPIASDFSRNTVTGLDFLGEVTFPTGLTFDGTVVGGLSGITYDRDNNRFYSIADDRSQFNPARFYTLGIDLSDGTLDDGDVSFTDVTTLTDDSGNPFPALSLDPESIVLTENGTLFISSEGDANRVINPFVNAFSLGGKQFDSLPIPDKFLPTADQSSGIRNNAAFESLAITPNGRYLYTATENALYQDGSAATLEDESPARILRFDLTTGQADKEILYYTDPVAEESVPPGAFATNGLVELLALDNNGNFLALERSLSAGVGNSVKLYEVNTQNTTDISGVEAIEGLEVDAVAEKRLLLDFGELGITLDNLEGIALGPVLPDGRRSLIVVSDNNFSDTQFTQFLAFAVDLKNLPDVAPTLETPGLNRIIDTNEPDADDPAIYVHPTDSSKSLVITALKDGGLAVYDLNGQEVQRLTPDDIRYNNIDLIYGFKLGDKTVDLAIATDRRNDTIAIFQIDPTTRQLSDITSTALSDAAASIFGIDDGSQTAYGIAAYTHPVSGKSYVFVSQREGNQIAQLELIDNGDGTVNATTVRTLSAPIPPDKELEDAQFEGMVVDKELGYLYAGQEQRGIWKFFADPDAATEGTLIEASRPEGDVLVSDVEGLTIYYGANGKGYLLVSSQGDSSYAVFDRQGSNDYLGSFVVDDGVDGVEESDGADVISVPLGDQFPNGLLVVHDGSNEPAEVVEDDGEIQNFSTNFKFVDWADVANSFDVPLDIDTSSYDPRNPKSYSLVNGVGSGDTTQTSTVLWTRSTFLGEVTFEYSTDPTFGTILGTAMATVTDAAQPVKVEIDGLTSGTRYYYRATDAAGATAEGQFKTANQVGTYTGLRFGVTGDWQQAPPYPSLSNADDTPLEFFLKLGDTIYADTETPALPGVTQARSLSDFRIKHSEITSPRFGLNTVRDLYASTSILATIDDHEIVDNFAGGAAPGDSPDAPDIGSSPDPLFTDPVAFVNDTQVYEAALQAFQDYHPIRNQFYGDTGDDRTANERQLYRYNTYGSDAAMFVLDSRSFRDAQLAPANPSNPTEFLVNAFNPDRTLLGDQQLTDLKQDLLNAEANGITWKFITIPEPIQNFGVINAEDRFEGYAAERTELLKFIDDNNIDNVVFLSGDFHGTIVNNLTYQTAPGGAQIASGAFEIVTGPAAFFDGLFGRAVTNIALAAGLITPDQFAFYDSLPVAPDSDSLPNDKDDFVKQLLISGTNPLGYDPVGLDGSDINATLLQGDYVNVHTYGWTAVDIDKDTQKLTVTTYGIPNYSEADLLANPALITRLTPTIVSQFEVTPTATATGTTGDDRLNGSNGDDRLLGGDGNDKLLGKSGNDTLVGGNGNDHLNGGNGNDIVTGGAGRDRFVLASGAGTDIITDFADGIDRLALSEGLTFRKLAIAQDANNTLISIARTGEVVASLTGIQASTLTSADFVSIV